MSLKCSSFLGLLWVPVLGLQYTPQIPIMFQPSGSAHAGVQVLMHCGLGHALASEIRTCLTCELPEVHVSTVNGRQRGHIECSFRASYVCASLPKSIPGMAFGAKVLICHPSGSKESDEKALASGMAVGELFSNRNGFSVSLAQPYSPQKTDAHIPESPKCPPKQDFIPTSWVMGHYVGYFGGPSTSSTLNTSYNS